MEHTLVRFDTATAVAGWTPVDDGVMGGVSRSRLRHDDAGFAVFEGIVSLEKGGGFASVRTRPAAFGAVGASHYLLDVRGDGKRYKLNLRTDETFDGVNYQALFTPPAGQWTTVAIGVAAFRASFRGREVPQAPPLDTARVRQLGLMIADRQAGPFRLDVKAIGWSAA